MLPVDKLSAELNRNDGIVMSMNSTANARASFDEDYFDAGRGEIASCSQPGNAGADY